MPLLPQGPPMPGMPMLPPAPQAQADPMMGGDPMAMGMGGPPGMPPPGAGGGANPTQDVVLGLLSAQSEYDAQAAEIMGMGAVSAQQRAQAGMMALSALVESMMAAPAPGAVGAISEPIPAGQAGMGLPPDAGMGMDLPPEPQPY